MELRVHPSGISQDFRKERPASLKPRLRSPSPGPWQPPRCPGHHALVAATGAQHPAMGRPFLVQKSRMGQRRNEGCSLMDV